MKLLAYALDYWSKGQLKALFLEHEVCCASLTCTCCSNVNQKCACWVAHVVWYHETPRTRWTLQIRGGLSYCIDSLGTVFSAREVMESLWGIYSSGYRSLQRDKKMLSSAPRFNSLLLVWVAAIGSVVLQKVTEVFKAWTLERLSLFSTELEQHPENQDSFFYALWLTWFGAASAV